MPLLFRSVRKHWYTPALTFPELPETLVEYSNGQYQRYFKDWGACLPDTFQENKRTVGNPTEIFRKISGGSGFPMELFRKMSRPLGIQQRISEKKADHRKSNSDFQKNEPTVGNPAAVFGKKVEVRDFQRWISEK